MLAVLAERRGPDGAQLAARERRLEHVPGVHRPLGRSGPDERVELVDEEDHLPLGLLDLLDDRLEPLLELAAELRAGHHRSEVERDDLLVPQAFGDVARGDAPGEPLDDGRLADARVADEDGVVLRPACQDLHDAADLVVAADDRVELSAPRELGQVARVALEGLVLPLGVRVVDPGAPAHLLEGREERGLGDAVLLQHVRGPRAAVAEESEEKVLEGDVVVAELPRDLLGPVQDLHERGAEAGFGAGSLDLRKAGDEVGELAGAETAGDADARQDGDADRGFVGQGRREVLRRHLRVPRRAGFPGHLLEELLDLQGVSVGVHAIGLRAGNMISASVFVKFSFTVLL